LQINNPLVFEPPPPGETPPPPKDGTRQPYTDKQLLRDLLEIVTSADFPHEGLSFKAEIAALRAALSHLQESFIQAESLEEQLKLTTAINHLTASLARLVRTQEYLKKNQPSPMNQALDRAIQDTLAEWGRT
jgi:hypothetical protein